MSKLNIQWLAKLLNKEVKKSVDPKLDYIVIGTFDARGKTRESRARESENIMSFEDLSNVILSQVPPSTDANNQLLTIEGANDELVLSNGTINGIPIPDSVIDMNLFTSLYDNHAPTKSGKLAPGTFTGSLIKEATVTFGSAFTDANYTPIVTIQSPDNYSATVKNITAASFTISLNSTVVPTVDVYWSAVKHGEY